MERTVSRPPVALFYANLDSLGESDYRLQPKEFLGSLKALVSTANGNIRLAQAQYKAYFDKALRPSAEDIRLGRTCA